MIRDSDALARELARAVALGYLPALLTWCILRRAERGEENRNRWPDAAIKTVRMAHPVVFE